MKRKSLIHSAILTGVFVFSLAFSPRVVQAYLGNTVTCYSEQRSKSGASYYNCGDCTERFNSKGKGSTSTCTTGDGGLPGLEE